MESTLLYISLLLNGIVLILLLVLLLRKTNPKQAQQVIQHLFALEKAQEKVERSLKEEAIHNRQEGNAAAKLMREELTLSLSSFHKTMSSQLHDLTLMNERKLEQVRQTLEEKLIYLQEDNSRKLEQMRQTVDEKLHATLEQRLGDSFKLISERLELVHRGLGEMQSIAVGVGDLKRVLSNVKTRGTLGEIALEALLEQIMTVDQYEKNVAVVAGRTEPVEFSVNLPAGEDKQTKVRLPIDNKIPLEDYKRLHD
ncbi:MAG: DNA recombination protein RmuC, partial [Clostridia bacterium]